MKVSKTDLYKKGARSHPPATSRPATPDYRLYLVTDSGMTGPGRLADCAAEAAMGGATMVQYREKSASTAQLIREAETLLHKLRPMGIPLIINDRVDVALAIGADGVHVGQNDMDPQTARRLMGPDAIIGYSVETPEQAQMAELWDIDYLGVSPIFATPTKTDTGIPWGLDGLRTLRTSTRIPLVAIGGMNRETIAETLKAGADGVAVVSAICAAGDPRMAARELLAIIDSALNAK
ncbi:thiamine phosphate synthase [Balneolales bacterium ANBcel1]|nr:thiamine phosphate synthase [Balneolales bacterium ANBcel1]